MSLLSCLLSIHIAGGTVALLSGPVPMLSHKGGWLHRRAGDVFAIAMLLAAVAGFMLALVKWNVLLMVIGVFDILPGVLRPASHPLPAPRPPHAA